MKLEIVEIHELQDCFDGTFSRDIKLNLPMNKEIIVTLAEKYETLYLENLPRPFYKIIIENYYTIKGFEGEFFLEANFRNAADIEELKYLFQLINNVL